MKYLSKIFFVLMVLCVAAIGYFIYNDFYKNKSTDAVIKIEKKEIVFKNDGKIHIVIDAGHGGKDVGAYAFNKEKKVVYEKNIARLVVDYVMRQADTTKYSVIETRIGDSMTHRHDRMVLAQKLKPDLLISFHCNAFSNKNWNGTEIHICDSTRSATDTTSIYNPFYTINKGLADTLLTNITNAFPGLKKDRVVTRKDRIWMIYAGHFPSVLIEWGYITNKKDIELMQKPMAQETLARVVWKTIDKHFGFEN